MASITKTGPIGQAPREGDRRANTFHHHPDDVSAPAVWIRFSVMKIAGAKLPRNRNQQRQQRDEQPKKSLKIAVKAPLLTVSRFQSWRWSEMSARRP